MSGDAVRFALSGSDFSKLLLAFIYYLWIYSFMICSQISLDPVWKAGTITANQSILRVSIRRKCSARIFCRSVGHFLIGQIFELFTTSGYKWVYSFQFFCCVSTQQHRATEEILLLSIHISTGWRTKHVVLQRESWDDLHGKHVFENYCWIFKGWAFWPQHSSFSRGNDCNWFNVASVRRTQTTDGLKVYSLSLSVYCFRLKTQGWKTISSYCSPESCTQCYMGQRFHVDQSWSCLCNDCEAAVSILLVFTAKGQSEQRKRIWPRETPSGTRSENTLKRRSASKH